MRALLTCLVLALVAAPVAPAVAQPDKQPAKQPKKKKGPKGAPIDPYAAKTPKPGADPTAPVDPYAPAPGDKEPVDPYADGGKGATAEQVPTVRGDAVTPVGRAGLDLTAVQGLLAVQRLDGWLLFD